MAGKGGLGTKSITGGDGANRAFMGLLYLCIWGLWGLAGAVVTPGDQELQEVQNRQVLLARPGQLMAIMRGICYCTFLQPTAFPRALGMGNNWAAAREHPANMAWAGTQEMCKHC